MYEPIILLRALPIPSGQHKIEFKFEPQTYYATENITLFSSLIVIIAIIFVAVFKRVKKINEKVYLLTLTIGHRAQDLVFNAF